LFLEDRRIFQIKKKIHTKKFMDFMQNDEKEKTIKLTTVGRMVFLW
jgi:hypothetical protein